MRAKAAYWKIKKAVLSYSITKITNLIKSLSAREIFKKSPCTKKTLWGGEFWTDGFYASAVGKYGNEKMIGPYVKNQGQVYTKTA